MSRATKDIFDGFISTFSRSADVIPKTVGSVRNRPPTTPADRSFKIIKDVLDNEYTDLQVGELMGKLLNSHELISESRTSKILVHISEPTCADLSKNIVRYRMFVDLIPNT